MMWDFALALFKELWPIFIIGSIGIILIAVDMFKLVKGKK